MPSTASGTANANEDTVRLCREPARPCRWDMDRDEVHRVLAEIKKTLAEMQTEMRVGNQRFSVLEKITFGFCAVIGVSFVGGLIALVLNQGAPS